MLMMTNPKYQKNMKIFSNAFRDQKEHPLERAVWWINWAMRNPKSRIFARYGNDINFLQIESVDVISFLTILCAIALYVIIWFLVKCLSFVYSSCKRSVNTKKKNE